MNLQEQSSEERFSAYVEGLVSVIGHADRAKPLRDYCLGLMLICARLSERVNSRIAFGACAAAQRDDDGFWRRGCRQFATAVVLEWRREWWPRLSS